MSLVAPGRLGAALLAVTLAGTLGLAADDAEAARRSGRVRVAKRLVLFDKGSGETTLERERRLARECRGRPNAGLCAGFGR